MAKVCLKEGCNNPRFSKGFCKWHVHLHPEYKKVQFKRTSISPVSKPMQIKLASYRVVRNAYMKEHPNCEFKDCCKPSQDLHHKAGRGKNLSNVSTFMAVCRNCHNFIHNNPKKSRELLYLL